ncbi:MAG TPA: gamma-glutamyltransferase, partial [Clostridia bacterium]|nr:gamma-glutamyltransferase [Clostridia bacterium]
YPYPSRRTLVYGLNGMVAASHPLAVQAGLHILQMGGNAVDAALAVGAALSVVDPSNNGIGGDCFAIIAKPDGEVAAYNGSGRDLDRRHDPPRGDRAGRRRGLGTARGRA